MFDLVYTNSCSFGAADQGHKIYPEYVATALDAQLVNRGLPGACNRRIIRTSLRDLNELHDKKNILALLGLTFVSRTELWQLDLPPQDNDGHFHSIIVDHSKVDWQKNGLINTVVNNIWTLARPTIKDYYKNWLLHLNMESEVVNLLVDLIMFTGWCKANNIQYLIFENTNTLPDDSKVGYNCSFVSSLRQTIAQDQDVLDLWNFSFKDFALANHLKPKDYDKYGEHGHPGPEAHLLFGNILLKHIGIS